MDADQAALMHVPAAARQDTELSLRVSLLVVATATAVAVSSAWLMVTSPWGADYELGWWTGLAANLFTIGVGLVAWRARPRNRVGPLLILAGMTSFIPYLTFGGHPLLWTVGDTWLLASIVVTANLYLAFPEGRTSGWSRGLVIAIYAWWFAFTVGGVLMREYPSTWPWQNPFLIWPNNEAAAQLGRVGDLGGLVLGVLVVATVIEKWRRGSAIARRALAPVLWVSPITLFFLATWIAERHAGIEGLFDFSTGGLAAASGFLLPAAFLIGLLRTKLERASIADLVRELDGVTSHDLESALARAVRDPSLRLVFPTEAGLGYVDSAGRKVDLETLDGAQRITRVGPDDDPLAILLHDGSIDEDLVESAAAASSLALENARLTAELRAQLEEVRASRLRIVEAADEERRRLERDLHDGAQQRLVALGFALRDAARQAREDPDLNGVLERAQHELEAGLRELRAIARGLHPTALDDGLTPAIHDLAARSPVPVAVEFEDAPLPGSVQTTAYFVAAEALTNALRHAQANRITIRGAIRDEQLRIEIKDDGVGGAEKATRGAGMRSLADRAQALGGSLSVQSPRGGGTLVVAQLPIR